MKSASKGRDAFLSYYTQILPLFKKTERLERFLTLNNPPVLLIAPDHEAQLQVQWQKQGLSWYQLRWFPHAYEWPQEAKMGTPLPGFKEGWVYALNPSSLLPVLALDPQNGETILDACAAPGGKTLALASLVDPKRTVIVANDSAFPRYKRLRSALKLFGYGYFQSWNYAAHHLSQHTDLQFDKILVDAPCSSEKHVYHAPKYLKSWSQKRIEKLAPLQLNLIASLLPLLKTDGQLIYSTCALTPEENEAVVAQTLSDHPELELVDLPPTLPIHRAGLADHGLTPKQSHQVLRLNELTGDWDPMFVARFRNTQKSDHQNF